MLGPETQYSSDSVVWGSKNVSLKLSASITRVTWQCSEATGPHSAIGGPIGLHVAKVQRTQTGTCAWKESALIPAR